MQFGSMSWREWTRIFFPPKRTKAKPVKQKKYQEDKRSMYKVYFYNKEEQTEDVFNCVTFTKSEARARFKERFGHIPPGTVFEKVV